MTEHTRLCFNSWFSAAIILHYASMQRLTGQNKETWPQTCARADKMAGQFPQNISLIFSRQTHFFINR